MTNLTRPGGFVYLVGAGIGGADYLTQRGLALLAQATAVVYDALVAPELLQLAPADCQHINVGKRGGQPSLPQPDIDRLLVQLCLAGHQVVRLKSGDPFVFGRTASEVQALRQAGCGFEVVPGISSALAAPLLAGIPLTDPVLSRCFAVLSAHEPDALNWEALAGLETLVVLMGTQTLAEVVDRLVLHGRSPHTPIAVLRWAGQPQQQSWVGTLSTILTQTAQQPLSPAVIVIGEVVALRSYLQPFIPSPVRTSLPSGAPIVTHSSPSTASKPSPLAGKTVLVTRAAGQSSQFTQLLQSAGATVLELPVLEIGPPSSWEGLDQAIACLSQFDWLVLTSTNGVEFFFERLRSHQLDARALAGVKIAVVGEKTAACLQQFGLQPDFVPPQFVADALVSHFPDPLQDLQILFPRVESGGREILVQAFGSAGATIVEVAAYQSGCAQTAPPELLQALAQGQVDVVTFASSKTVRCFQQLLSTTGVVLPASTWIASIGPQTSTACTSGLGRVDVEAEEYTLEGLVQAVVRRVEAS